MFSFTWVKFFCYWVSVCLCCTGSILDCVKWSGFVSYTQYKGWKCNFWNYRYLKISFLQLGQLNISFLTAEQPKISFLTPKTAKYIVCDTKDSLIYHLWHLRQLKILFPTLMTAEQLTPKTAEYIVFDTKDKLE